MHAAKLGRSINFQKFDARCWRDKKFKRSVDANALQTAQAAQFYLLILLKLHGEAHNGWKKFGTIFRGQLEFLQLKH